MATIYVNWAEVLRDQPIDPVFANLCSGDPKYLEGIFSIDRYKRYFTLRSPVVPELGPLINGLKRADDPRKWFYQFLKQTPIPYVLLEFEGRYGGHCSDIPTWTDEKTRSFYQTTKGVGYQLQYMDIDWIVLYSRMSDDRVIKPFVRYIFIMAPYAVFQLQPTYPSCFEFEGDFIETTK